MSLINLINFPPLGDDRGSLVALETHKTVPFDVKRVYYIFGNQAILTTQRPVIQECVGNDDVEYTAGALYFDGECNATIVMRRDLRDGNTYRAYVDKSTELNEQVNYFARKLKPFGPVNFQFRLCNGNVKVFEINGRFSGTTPLRMHAGFNEVEMCVRHLLCGEPIKQPEISQITILRHWSETIINSDTTPPKKYYD